MQFGISTWTAVFFPLVALKRLCCIFSYTKKKLCKDFYALFNWITESLRLLCTGSEAQDLTALWSREAQFGWVSMETKHTGCTHTMLGHQSSPAPTSWGFMPTKKTLCNQISAEDPTSPAHNWHLKATAEVEEGELYFASCSLCCYKGPKHLAPPQQGPSGTCCQSLNPTLYHPFPVWRWKKAIDAPFHKWKHLFD